MWFYYNCSCQQTTIAIFYSICFVAFLLFSMSSCLSFLCFIIILLFYLVLIQVVLRKTGQFFNFQVSYHACPRYKFHRNKPKIQKRNWTRSGIHTGGVHWISYKNLVFRPNLTAKLISKKFVTRLHLKFSHLRCIQLVSLTRKNINYENVPGPMKGSFSVSRQI